MAEYQAVFSHRRPWPGRMQNLPVSAANPQLQRSAQDLACRRLHGFWDINERGAGGTSLCSDREHAISSFKSQIVKQASAAVGQQS